MDYNISILPSQKTEQRLIELSSKIHQSFDSQIRLNTEDSLPHLTLYLAGFPITTTHEIYTKLKAICSKYAPVKVQIKGWTISKGGLVMLNCIVSSKLKSLHREIITEINSLREGIVADTWMKGISDLNERQVYLLNMIGFPYALELWSPHFTIARVNPAYIGEVKPIIDEFEDEFIGQIVGLGYSGEGGIFTRLISTCSLKPLADS